MRALSLPLVLWCKVLQTLLVWRLQPSASPPLSTALDTISSTTTPGAVGDSCKQEGVGCEAFSYAGHLKLGKLTVIYDNNQISCDGSVDLTNNEEVNKKMEACGWQIFNVEDGSNDIAAIVATMERGREKTDKSCSSCNSGLIDAGEDGPTHHPVKLAALYRAMPHMQYIRLDDSEEVAGAWKTMIENTDGPFMISVSLHAHPQLAGLTKREGVEKDADVTLISVGADPSFAVNVDDALVKQSVKARVLSFPSHTLLRAQPLSYQREVLRRNENIPAVVIEPYVALGWERYADAGINMSSFGHSLPGKYIYDHFSYGNDTMPKKVQGILESWKKGDVGRGECVEL
ncbi:hypothetical protein BU25DRAFT_459509 [Macroventuria anomochaeta]|uniref:Uncharacterized protein n=1 Tax=Macroventuria anomochaeta TaxID=301207 RepID=A0ACB6RZR2_9PLEO|nr:uncharacterized protein BU25DRAFT_459509 [Macroventuria anomochaeta]KAF2626377.1 hypothetical protein BU25DRAFT_459509 [Macroventuria anomochaeta]